MRRTFWFLVLVVFLAGVPSLFAQRGREYAIVLQDPPVVQQISSRKELGRAYAGDLRRRIEATQANLRAELARRGISVVCAVQTLVNAVFVRTTEDKVAELRGLPGVKRVDYLPPMRLHLNRAVQLVGATGAWGPLGGIDGAGKGIKIGIVDTGIDQNHPAFHETLLPPPPGFPKCVGADCAFTNKKVIVARSYVSMVAAGFTSDNDPSNDADEIAATSRPDDLSPRDRVGHGTATAMIAAGLQNTAPNGITITGVAPRAFLGNYKVFGSPGVNDFTFASAVISALDDAFKDGMDVVSLSLGSPALYGPLDRGFACNNTDPNLICDVRADAVQNAVSNGMAVAVSAGNDGDLGAQFPTLNSVATPGTAPAAITVGASTNSHVFFASVRIAGSGVPSNLQSIDALFGDGPRPDGTLTALVRDVSKLGNDGKACSPLSGGSLAGAIAVVDRGDCFFSVKVNNSQAAGASGVIIVRDDSDVPFSPAGLTDTAIPAVMIGHAAGQSLKAFLNSSPDSQATLDPTLVPRDTLVFNTTADFSSRGPSIGNFGIKPELVAVGTDLFTATQKYDPNSDMYDPTGYGAFSGTSFSAPLVAGAAALVKQTKPSLTPAQIKSALVNTAANSIMENSAAPVTSVGAGMLNAAEAARFQVAIEPSTLSFGVIGSGSLPIARTLRITNVAGGLLKLSLAAVPTVSNPNPPASLALSPNSLQLSAGNAAVVTVTLQGVQPPPGTYEGVITVQGMGTNQTGTLRVPYIYFVGDGIPYNIFPVLGDGFDGTVGQPIPGNLIGFKLIDRFGVPVEFADVVFHPPAGGSIDAADAQTDAYGIAAASVTLGSQLGDQTFTADATFAATTLTVEFNGRARLRPTISSNGVENAGSGEPATAQKGVAPGSYIAIKGQALSSVTRVYSTLYLPLSLANVSVSFDAPTQGISVPGRIHFVSDGQVNVQIPWELEGLNSVKVKVSIGDVSSAVVDLPLARNSPAFFEVPLASGIAAALDEGNNLVSTTNPVARGKVVQLFCNGLGPVDNHPPSGEPTPATQPLVQVLDPVTVTIGGRPANVEFKGLTPTVVGLYQLNVRVPSDAPTGLQDLVLTAGGVTAKTVKLPVQ